MESSVKEPSVKIVEATPTSSRLLHQKAWVACRQISTGGFGLGVEIVAHMKYSQAS